MVRVDAQVLDRVTTRDQRATKDDFVLRQNGKVQEIRNFSKEDMPADVLLLLDVSGSMRPHVERIAFASQEAMHVLGPDDRVAIMVFDRSTRVRLPFRRAGDEIYNELQRLLRQETFDGGTDITRAMFDAASYIARNGRRDARRAIVILTDDETERGNDVQGVERALDNSGTVLSLLLAPDAMGTGRAGGGMGYPAGTRAGVVTPAAATPEAVVAAADGADLADHSRSPGRRLPGGGYPTGGGGRYPGGGGGNYPAAGERSTAGRILRGHPRSPRRRAATRCRWTMPRRSRARWHASGSAMRCTSICPPTQRPLARCRWNSLRMPGADTRTRKFVTGGST